MSWNTYIDWIEANFTSQEAGVFMLGIGLGVFVQCLRWCIGKLRQGGKIIH